jgi:L-threonylcarbamoyladenylate synthase
MEKAIEVLKNGGIVIFPTDTAFGIGCRIDNEDAIKKVYSLRNRPSEKALIALVASIEMAKEYVEIPSDVKEKLVDKFWPGGLTIILKCKKDKVPGVLRAEGETLAVRFPDHKELCKIINEVGVPIAAPSANYHSMPTPFELSEVDPTLQEKVDFVLEGVCTMRGVSTIVDTTVVPWKIVRDGVVRLSTEDY